MLSKYTDKELREELARRAEERKQARATRVICKNCAHWDSIDMWGRPKTKEKGKLNAYCPFYALRYARPKMVNAYHEKCDDFKQNEK